MPDAQTVLVTGATGYIGGRLVPKLIQAGHRVRILVRNRNHVSSRPWAEQVQVVVGDVLQPETLSPALEGVDTSYYLVHSMAKGGAFEELDVQAARFFAATAREAAVGNIIYLGGLGDPESNLSSHLRSRQQTGQALRECGVPVTEFRAAVVIGSGSISFEIIRSLVERLPIMVCPKWVYSQVQPIAVGDLLEYLVSALDNPQSKGQLLEVGGESITTYRGLMEAYAKARGLRRLLLPVPVLTPRLSSYWVHWVTPIPAALAAPLIDGLRNDVVVTSSLARALFPHIEPKGFAEAMAGVVKDLDEGRIDTSWSDATAAANAGQNAVRLETGQGMILERRRRSVAAPPHVVYRTFTGIGGGRGWFFANWAWSLRGILDRMLGGSGLRRGRRHPEELRVGDALDFWRVEALETNHLLRLRAEMKSPGNAWLQFEVREGQQGQAQLEQLAVFNPRGVGGLAYWYALYPFHAWIFRGLIKAIALRAERIAAGIDAQTLDRQT